MIDKREVEQLLAAVVLSRMPGVGSVTFKELVIEHESPTRALAAHRNSRHLRHEGSKGKTPLTDAQHDALSHLPPLVKFTYMGAPDYPPKLAEIPEPAPYIFRKGPLWPLLGPSVAIVGTRRCTSRGRSVTQTLAAQLASEGVTIVSGGALGIDAAAHAGALEVKGRTVLVSATGIDLAYPLENEPLYQQIADQGCVLTELLPGTPPRGDFFPTRNRILVGLCDATLIVEGTLESGTATSARHALKLGRPLFTWPSSPEMHLRELPEHLIERGAIPLSCTSAASLLATLES